MRKLQQFLVVILALMMVQACGEDPSGPDFSTVPPPYDTTQAVNTITSDDGLIIYQIEEGYGAFTATSRDQVRARFTGRTQDGRVFDSSYTNGFTTPRTFSNLNPIPISGGFGPISPLIDGFRRGILGMKEGEKRTIVVPPELGYGDSQEGTNGFDLRDETLIFDIELVEIINP